MQSSHTGTGVASADGIVGVARGLQTVAGSRGGGVILQLHSLRLWGARGMASYPPHTVLDMPALSPTMSQVVPLAWHGQVTFLWLFSYIRGLAAGEKNIIPC